MKLWIEYYSSGYKIHTTKPTWEVYDNCWVTPDGQPTMEVCSSLENIIPSVGDLQDCDLLEVNITPTGYKYTAAVRVDVTKDKVDLTSG